MDRNEKADTHPPHILHRVWKSISRIWKKEDVIVYFVSGMCYNCHVFDKLVLPRGFKKRYIEWYIPKPGESLNDYVHTMAKAIDTSRPYVLVGYSFGAVVIQEMNKFLSPQQSIIISSFKDKWEIPMLFKAAKKTNLLSHLPDRLYSSTSFITNSFNKLVYSAPTSDLSDYMTYTDPVYIKWAVWQITNWVPENGGKHFYHIHGVEDQIFPFDRIRDAFAIEGGDHLAVLKKASVVSSILAGILLTNSYKLLNNNNS